MLIHSLIQISIMTHDSWWCWHHLRIHIHMSSVGSLLLFGKRKLTLHRIRYDLVVVVLLLMMMMLDEWLLRSLISLDLSTRRKIDTIDTACACALENLFLIRQPTKKAIDGQSTGFPPNLHAREYNWILRKKAMRPTYNSYNLQYLALVEFTVM